MFPRGQVRGEHTSRKIDKRGPAGDDTRQAKSMRNRTAAQLLPWYARLAHKHVQCLDKESTDIVHSCCI